ncbi:hypothetical protein R1flu_009626 [Riccia fluitans]|uniref:RRM domain-containing protein n=1 Tax=Riccia fluitans TaxID=41844 RepID=A0ABD1Z3Q9_9MARC
MSLDDLIKTNKQVGRGGGRGGKAISRRGAANASAGGGYSGGGKISGPARRLTNRTSARPNPYATAKASKRHSLMHPLIGNARQRFILGCTAASYERWRARSYIWLIIPDTSWEESLRRAPDTTWQHDLYEDGTGVGITPGGRGLGIETGTKLYISNLDYGVSNDDIKELFSEVGDLKRCSIHYDRSGRSKGTAEVVFSRRADAVAALKRYNNVQLDGKPMKIELIGTNLSTGAPSRAANGALAAAGGRGRTVVMTPGFARAAAAASLERRAVASGSNRGRGVPTVEKTAEDLDAELESYHAEAMQTS